MTDRVFLVRHGQTVLNAEDRLRGLADPELDETGIGEAGAVARALAESGARAVLSSPLRRAVRTAQIIAATTGAPHRVEPGFQDRDYGEWTGHLRSEVLAEWGSIDNAPGVEPREIVATRALAALDELNDGDCVIVVTHDAVIRPLLLHFGAHDPVVPTASWSELMRDGDGWRVVSVGMRP
jgi:broad specificity phosphatase PhoE